MPDKVSCKCPYSVANLMSHRDVLETALMAEMTGQNPVIERFQKQNAPKVFLERVQKMYQPENALADFKQAVLDYKNDCETESTIRKEVLSLSMSELADMAFKETKSNNRDEAQSLLGWIEEDILKETYLLCGNY